MALHWRVRFEDDDFPIFVSCILWCCCFLCHFWLFFMYMKFLSLTIEGSSSVLLDSLAHTTGPSFSGATLKASRGSSSFFSLAAL